MCCDATIQAHAGLYFNCKHIWIGRDAEGFSTVGNATPERNDAMRKVNRNAIIYRKLAEAQMSDYDRQRAIRSVEMADAIVGAVMWVKSKVASAGAMMLRPGFKH
jgi:hypothetical protein